MLVKLKVHPESRKSSLIKKAEDAFEIWIKAPAREGLANEAALAVLAKALGKPRAKLRIVKGAASPSKIVQVWD